MVDPSLLKKHGPIVVQLHPTNSLDHGGGKLNIPSPFFQFKMFVVGCIHDCQYTITGNYRKEEFIIELLYYNLISSLWTLYDMNRLVAQSTIQCSNSQSMQCWLCGSLVASFWHLETKH